jgi:hypothetical protein
MRTGRESTAKIYDEDQSWDLQERSVMMAGMERSDNFFLRDYHSPPGILLETGSHTPGQWKYMPYRGPGHLKLWECLRLNKAAECYVDDDLGRVEFVVIGVPVYGFLEVSAVSRKTP